MRRLAAAIALLAPLALASAATAAVLPVTVNHTVKLAVRGAAASVVVGNPDVADVHVVDSRTVFVAGRSSGSTDVTVLDALGRTIYAADVVVSPPATGRVAVYRGGERSDLSCDPACTSANGAGAGAGGGAASAAGPASTAALSAASLGSGAATALQSASIPLPIAR
jgi:hypothetical protein